MRTVAGDIVWVLRVLRGVAVRVRVRRIRKRISRRRVSGRTTGFPRHTKTEQAEYKKQARVLVLERLKHFNRHYNLEYQKVFIKNQKTRWGSCSVHKNLNFNYQIIFLEKEVQDYLIVHELCHLKEMNHGKRFWNLVAEQIPEYKTSRRKLRTVSVG